LKIFKKISDQGLPLRTFMTGKKISIGSKLFREEHIILPVTPPPTHFGLRLVLVLVVYRPDHVGYRQLVGTLVIPVAYRSTRNIIFTN
jgi:hypothetical protein